MSYIHWQDNYYLKKYLGLLSKYNLNIFLEFIHIWEEKQIITAKPWRDTTNSEHFVKKKKKERKETTEED